MGMSEMERATLLGKWIKPSSDSEQTQQARAEDMVRKAITTDAVFDGSNILIYTKGSYPNNTNVKLDSDVDVVVEPQDCSSSNTSPALQVLLRRLSPTARSTRNTCPRCARTRMAKPTAPPSPGAVSTATSAWHSSPINAPPWSASATRGSSTTPSSDGSKPDSTSRSSGCRALQTWSDVGPSRRLAAMLD